MHYRHQNSTYNQPFIQKLSLLKFWHTILHHNRELNSCPKYLFFNLFCKKDILYDFINQVITHDKHLISNQQILKQVFYIITKERYIISNKMKSY